MQENTVALALAVQLTPVTPANVPVAHVGHNQLCKQAVSAALVE